MRTAYTRETVAAMVSVCRRRWGSRVRIRRRVWLAAEGILAALGLLYWFFQGMTLWDLVLLVIFLAALIAASRKDQKREEQAADEIWARWPDKGAALVFRFSPEDFQYQTPASACRYRYSVLGDLLEDGGYFFLFLAKDWAYVLKKGDFTQGSPEAFRSFLQQKTGHPVEFIK